MKTVVEEYTLCVDNVAVKTKATNILQDVTFTATTGSLLAILGPTGEDTFIYFCIVVSVFNICTVIQEKVLLQSRVAYS